MKKVFNRCLGLWVVVFVFLSLTGCVRHITKMQICERLDHDALYKSFNVHPIDLSLRSQCNHPPSVKIVNIESRIQDYDEFDDYNLPPRKHYITPVELMDCVSMYLKGGFEASNIKADDQSTKILQLKMVELKTTLVWAKKNGFFKMELIIPEKNFSKTYETWEASGEYDFSRTFLQAPINAIHVVTRQIIDDPVIQDYILCK